MSSSALEAPLRLADLHRTDLLDSPAEESFDRYTRLVSRVLGVPVSLVSLVDDQRQFFKSSTGLAEPWCSLRGTALSHSFCQHVVSADAPFVVTDSATDPRVVGNGAVRDLSVAAYAGVPLHGPGGTAIGSLCAIDHRPRTWSDADVEVLQELADALSELIALRTAAVARRAAVQDLSHRLRSGLTALHLEAEEVRAAVTDGRVLPALTRLLDGLADQSATVDAALQAAGSLELGHEQELDLDDVLADVATRSRALAQQRHRTVVVLPGTGDQRVSAPRTELTRVLDAVVRVVLAHGAGQVDLSVVAAGDSAVRVRVQSSGDELPAAVAGALSTRQDAGAVQDPVVGISLAERAARALGGRLLLTSSSPPVVDLVLPRPRER